MVAASLQLLVNNYMKHGLQMDIKLFQCILNDFTPAFFLGGVITVVRNFGGNYDLGIIYFHNPKVSCEWNHCATKSTTSPCCNTIDSLYRPHPRHLSISDDPTYFLFIFKTSSCCWTFSYDHLYSCNENALLLPH